MINDESSATTIPGYLDIKRAGAIIQQGRHSLANRACLQDHSGVHVLNKVCLQVGHSGGEGSGSSCPYAAILVTSGHGINAGE